MSSNKNNVESTTTRKLGSRKSYSQAKANARKDVRRNEAEARNAKYASLTTTQKLKTVPVGGGTKQRARLEAQLAAEKATAKVTATVVPVKAVTPTSKVKTVAKQAAASSSKTGSVSSKTGSSSSSSVKKASSSSKTGSVSSKTGGSSSKR